MQLGPVSSAASNPAPALEPPTAARTAAPRVRVRFEGNHSLDDGVLRSVTTTDKTDGAADAPQLHDLVERDALLVKAAYYNHGYLLGSTGEPVITPSLDGNFVDVVIPIVKEGPRFRIGRLTIAETDAKKRPIKPLGNLELRKWLSPADGDWFGLDVLIHDIGALRTHYRDHGYADAAVDPETILDEPHGIVDISVSVERGPLTRIERIAIVGNRTIDSAKLRRAIPILDGDLFGESKLEDAKRLLLRTLPIRNASFTTQHGSAPDRILITLEVED